MTGFVAVVVVFGLGLCLALGWLWRRLEQARIARRWIERERLLDRRHPPMSSKEIRRRRARRGRQAAAGRRPRRTSRASTRFE